MRVARWSRAQATGFVGPTTVDDLDAVEVLILDGVTAADDDRLGWCRLAACVVVAATATGPAPATVDVAAPIALVDRLVERVQEHPAAARTLVDVLRVLPALDVPGGLLVESLAYSTLLAGPEFAGWLERRPARPVRASDGPPVVVRRDGNRLELTLNRPENRNAFSAPLRDGLVEALAVAASDPSVHHVVVDAAGPSFSSGGDLGEFGTAADPVRAHQIRFLRSVGRAIAGLDARTEVRVHGRCVGAGVELPAFADHVVAAPDTTLRLPEIEMGLIPGAGGTVSLTRRLGRQRTALLALLGDEVAVDDPLVAGYADRIG